MSEFKTIETQEQLDQIIGERLKRERETTEKKYSGFLSPEDVAKKYDGYLSPEQVKEKYNAYLSPEEAAEKDAKIKRYETNSVKMRIAHETGLPYEMAERLRGDNEEDLLKDAESLSKLMDTSKGAPVFTDEPNSNGKKAEEAAKNAAYKKMLKGMKGE